MQQNAFAMIVMAFLAWSCTAKCSGYTPHVGPLPYQTATRVFYGSPSLIPTTSPSLYVLQNCAPPDVEKRHVEYREWLSNKHVACERLLVENIGQLEAVSKRIETPSRVSFRAEPAAVDVVWPEMAVVLVGLSGELWPGEDRRLNAELQTVLYYRHGDSFGAHIDRCEETGQEGVLIVDLGFRDTYDPQRPEMFFEEADKTPSVFAGNWSAAGPGAWVGFPMHHRHGVYPTHGTRVVAVYTLLDPSLMHPPLCAGYAGSCNVGGCRPGEMCMMT